MLGIYLLVVIHMDNFLLPYNADTSNQHRLTTMSSIFNLIIQYQKHYSALWSLKTMCQFEIKHDNRYNCPLTFFWKLPV